MGKLKNNPLLVIFFTVFIDLIGFGILIPIIPLLLANPRSPFYLLTGGASIQDGFIMLGFLTAIYPICQFIAAPILGQLSDKFGRKRILIISLIGTCISYIVFAIGIITANIPLLFIARGLDGITGGNISVAQAAIADITTPENRAKNFGLIGAAFGLGFILGPYIGGKLSDPTIVSWFDATTPFWFAAFLSFINILSVALIFPETHLTPNKDRVIEWGKSIANVIKAFGNKTLNPLFITSALFTGGFTFFTSFASVFFINKFGFSQGNVGDLFSYVGLWIAFTQVVITRRLSSKYSEKQVVQVSLFGTAVGIALLFLAGANWQLYFIMPIFAIFNGLVNANLTALISRSADQEVQGEVLGLGSSVQAIAQSIPPILSGYIAASLTPETPLLVAAIVIAVSGVWFILLRNRIKGQFHQEGPAVAMSH